MQREGSIASGGGEDSSFGGSSAFEASAHGSETEEHPAGQDETSNSMELLNQQGNIQEALFGVLYMLSKERLAEGWKFVLFAMTVDYLQLAVFFISYNFPWDFDSSAWYWKWLSWVNFTNLFPRGTGLINGNYHIYLGVFYTLVGVLLAALVLCTVIGVKFKDNSFTYVWPVQMLKAAMIFFFEVFYISILGIFTVALDCTFSSAPILNEVIAITMAYFVAVTNSELDPACEVLTSQANNRIQLNRFALISLISILQQLFPSFTKIQAIAGIIITTYLCFEYVRYVPFKTSWINGLQASFFGSLSWASLLILLMAFFFQGSKIITFTVLLWAGLLVVIPLVWIVLYLRTRHAHKVALKWRLALKTGVPVVHKFLDEQEVEVVARCGRIRDQWGDTIPDWIDTAEAVFKAGIDQFPESAYLHIAYSSFLIYQRRSAQAGLALLKASRKLEPSIGERFTIFVREREEKRAASTDSGSDLQGYIELQTSYKALLEVHKQALKTTRNFWRQLCHKDVSFAKLTRSFTAMDAAEKHADKTFKFVLDRHPNSAKLLRAYGTYLESVKTQPTQGARYHAEAQRLEDQAAQHGGLTYGDDGDKSSQLAEWSVGASVNESSDAVVVADEAGILLFVNKKAVQMFGYKLGDLDGKPVSLLMPPPFSSHHSQYMQRYKKTGQAAHVGKPAAPVLALHAEGFNFAVSLTVKLLQQGDAKRVMGIFKPVKDDDHVGQMWVGVMGNIIGVDRGLQDLLGYHSSDLSGQTVSAVGADGGVEHHLKHCADRLKAWQYTREELDTTFYSFEVPWKHKYGAPMTVSVHASYSGTEHVRLIALRFVSNEKLARLGLISLSSTGQVVYVNPCVERMLGYEPGMLMARRKTIADLLGTPFAQLHLRWMQMAARTVEPAAVCPISCRSGRPVVLLGRNNKQVAVRMEVVPTQVGKLCCLTAAVTEVDVRGMDAWGGGDLKELVKRCKRMLLLVHGNGTVLAVNVDPTVASHRFGQSVSDVCGKNISQMVEGFTAVGQPRSKNLPSVSLLLARLAKHTSHVQAAGGSASFRVSMTPHLANSKLSNSTFLKPNGSIPCRMVVLPVTDTEVDVQQLVDEGSVTEADWSSGGLLMVELWCDDMLEAILEVDAQLKIKSADLDAPYLFGCGAERLVGQPVTKFLQPVNPLASCARAEDFLGVKRTQLKHKADQGVSEKQEMTAVHVDGSKMNVTVQAADKYGDGSRWVVRVVLQPNQARSQRTLVDILANYSKLTLPASQHSSAAGDAEAPDFRLTTDTADHMVHASAGVDGRSEHSGDDRSSAADSDAAGSQGSFSAFQRAKRFRKLNKMLTSHKALQAVSVLKRYSIFMLLLLMGVHTVFFSLGYKRLEAYTELFQRTVTAGDGANGIRNAMTGARILQSIQDVTNPYSLFASKGPAECAAIKEFYGPYMLVQAEDFASQEHSLLFGTSPKKLQAPVTAAERQLYLSEDRGVTEVERWPFSTAVLLDPTLKRRANPASLWDLSNRFVTAIRLTAVPPAGIASSLSNYSEYNFLWDNRDAEQDHLLESMDVQYHSAQERLSQESQVMIVFFAVEAAAVIPLCCLCLWLVVNLVNRDRLKLVNIFLVVPRPVVMQLASKDVNVNSEDTDGEEADDNNNDAWKQQENEEVDTAGGAQSSLVGYNLSSARRRSLHDRSLQTCALKLLAPFTVWCVIVCIVYGVSIIVLQTSVDPIVNLIAANRIPFFVSSIVGYTVAATATADNGPGGTAAFYQGMIRQSMKNTLTTVNGLLYGDPSLGLEGSLHQGDRHEALWFGSGCLNVNLSACYQPGDRYYADTTNGLMNMLTKFTDASFRVATYDANFLTFDTTAVDFILSVALPGGCLADALQQNTKDYLDAGKSTMKAITIIQVVAVVLSLVVAWYYYFYLLLPYLRMVKEERHRVAVLLSQLPREMNAEAVVRKSASEDEHGDQHSASCLPGAGWRRAITGCLLGWCGPARNGKVVPADPGSGGKLSIVVTNRTSKDREVPIPSPPSGRQGLSKLKTYKETMRRHQSEPASEADDPTLWDTHRSPRRVAFKFPDL